MFIPDDLRLRSFAFGIAEQRRHSLRKPDDKEGPEIEREADEARAVDPEDQLSLFAAISAVPLDEDGKPLEPTAVFEEPSVEGEGGDGDADGEAEEGEVIPGLVDGERSLRLEREAFALTAPGLGEAEVPTPEPDPVPVSPRTRKRQLRELNSARVRSLVHKTRTGHAHVNAELNRRVGIRRITEATVPQLERRLEVADRWLDRLR
jgi:hypothetical protein